MKVIKLPENGTNFVDYETVENPLILVMEKCLSGLTKKKETTK